MRTPVVAQNLGIFITGNINRLFVNREPWQVATLTATVVLSAAWLWNFANQEESNLLIIT